MDRPFKEPCCAAVYTGYSIGADIDFAMARSIILLATQVSDVPIGIAYRHK